MLQSEDITPAEEAQAPIDHLTESTGSSRTLMTPVSLLLLNLLTKLLLRSLA